MTIALKDCQVTGQPLIHPARIWRQPSWSYCQDMEISSTAQDWAPDACTLPVAQLPARLAEFTRLFADLVIAADRVRPDRLQLELTPTTSAAARVAELAVAESECCSFFAFTLRIKAGRLLLDVEVPETQVAALDGLAVLAGSGPK